MRKAFMDALTEQAKNDSRVMLLTADTGFHVFDQFQKDYPEQYLNVGISEAAMIGMAAGLAMNGRRVFVYGIAPFVTLRCLEQIRVDLCCHNLPVTVVGVGAGLTYGPAGPTHHTIEDVAVMQCLPNMTVLCPGDPAETTALMDAIRKLPGPSYLRLGKSGEPLVHKKILADFAIGKGVVLSQGQDLALITTGTMLHNSSEAVTLLAEQGISATLVSMPTVKPFDKKLVRQLAQDHPIIGVVEEHSIIGGLASAVASFIAALGMPVRVLALGIPDCFTQVAGSQEFFREQYGLSGPGIAASLRTALEGGGS